MTVLRRRIAGDPTRPWLLIPVLVGLLAASCVAPDEEASPVVAPSKSDALAYRTGMPAISILEPADQATVTSPVTIRVTTSNIDLAPAGRTVDGEAHFHILIDQGCRPSGELITSSENIVHVGDGSSEKTIELAPGRHQICVQLGDGFHVAIAVIDRITIFVEE